MPVGHDGGVPVVPYTGATGEAAPRKVATSNIAATEDV